MLLRRFVLNNDADAFSGLSEQYAPLVYRVCWRILRDEHKAADATQETFLQLVRHAHKIRGSVAAWLHRVATGKAIDIIRREKRRREVKQEFGMDFGDRRPSWDQLSVQIDEALNQLDSGSRDILIEHYLENRSTREIAQRKGVSQATVSRRANAALQTLRKRLGTPGLAITSAVLSSMFADNSAQAVPAQVVRALGKMGLAGRGTSLGLIGKATYLVGGLEPIPKALLGTAVIALGVVGTLPLANRAAKTRQEPAPTVASETLTVDQNESPPDPVSAMGGTDPQSETPSQQGPPSQTANSVPAGEIPSAPEQEAPRVVLSPPTYYRYGPSSKPKKQTGPVEIKVDEPRNTIKTFIGLLAQQDMDRADACFLAGSDGSKYWQEIAKASTPEHADLKQVYLALTLPVEITQIWQEKDRVGVAWICNVTKELDLKVLKRKFIPWDAFALEVELKYANGQWLIDQLWSE